MTDTSAEAPAAPPAPPDTSPVVTAGSVLFDTRADAEAAVDAVAAKAARSAVAAPTATSGVTAPAATSAVTATAATPAGASTGTAAKAGQGGMRPGKVRQIAGKVAQRGLRHAIVDTLDVRLSGIVLRAWQGHDALLATARRTAKSGARELVLLADHVVTSTHSPQVALTIDGIDLGRITSSIVLSLRLAGITAVVQRGELVGIETGALTAAAKLSVEGVPVASRERTMDAVAAIALRHPIRLAGAAAPSA